MLDFALLPPEVNSGRMYSGPGPGPLLAASEAWDSLAAELGFAASGYGSALAELTSNAWVGPTSVAMMSAVTPYIDWLTSTGAQAEETANHARAAVAAYEAAFAMTVPPPVIAANRALLAALVATNFFGQNTPAIMMTEALYAEMWAQDAAAMYGYAGASLVALQVTPFASRRRRLPITGRAARLTRLPRLPLRRPAKPRRWRRTRCRRRPPRPPRRPPAPRYPRRPPRPRWSIGSRNSSKTPSPIPLRRLGGGLHERQPERVEADLPGLLRGRSRKLRLWYRPAVDYSRSGHRTIQPGGRPVPGAGAGTSRLGRHRRSKRRTVHSQQCVGPNGRGQQSRAAVGARGLARGVARGGGRGQVGQRRKLVAPTVNGVLNGIPMSASRSRRRCWTPWRWVHGEVRGRAAVMPKPPAGG